MIYKIVIDNNPDPDVIDDNYLYYSGDSVYTLDDIELNLVLGEAGELRFTIYSNHPNFNLIQTGNYHIYMFRDSEMIFDGFISEIVRSIYNSLTVYCTGILGALNFSIQPQAKYKTTPRNYFAEIIGIHNGYADLVTNKPWEIIDSTVDIPTQTITRYTDYESTLECLRRDLIESFGVYPKIYHAYTPGSTGSTGKTPVLYLKTIENYGELSNQVVELGTNILDYVENESIDNLYTAVIPLGEEVPEWAYQHGDVRELQAYTTIAGVNIGAIYLYNATNVAKYGFKCAVVHWDDIYQPSVLMEKGQEWLDSAQYSSLRFEMTAVDLAMLDVNYDAFSLGDRVNVRATPLGVNITVPIYEMTIYPLRPEDNRLVLGADAPSLIGRPISVSQVKTEADIYTLGDWNYDYFFDGIVLDVSEWGGQYGPNYWNTEYSEREPVTLCNSYTYVYPAGGPEPTYWDLNIKVPTLLSQENLCIDIAGIDYVPSENTVYFDMVSPDGTYDTIAVADHPGRYIGSFSPTTDGFGEMMPQEDLIIRVTPSTARALDKFELRLNSITGVIQRKIFPWYVDGIDANGVDHDGLADTIEMNSARWVRMRGERFLKGTFIWPDADSHPDKLAVSFTIDRTGPRTDLLLVDQNGNNIWAGNNLILGEPYRPSASTDVIFEVMFGNVKYQFTNDEITTDGQTLTLDLTGDTQDATLYQGHYYKQIIFHVNTDDYILITDVHINGDLHYLYANPYNELTAF